MNTYLFLIFSLFYSHVYAQTFELKKDENSFLFKADTKKLIFKDSKFNQSVAVRTCNKKITKKLVSDIFAEEKFLKLKKVSFNKSHWASVNKKRYPLLPLSDQTKRIESFPIKFISYAVESEKICKDKKRKISSEVAETGNTPEPTPLQVSTPQKQCVDTLCPSQIFETSNLSKNLISAALFLTEDYKKEIGSSVQNAIDAEKNVLTLMGSRTLQWSSQDGKLNTPYEKKLFTGMVALRLQDQMTLEFNKNGNLVVNRAATLAANPLLKNRDLDTYAPIIERFYKNIFFDPLATRPWNTMLLVYNNQEISEKINQMINTIDTYKNEPALRDNWSTLSQIPDFGFQFDTNRLREELAKGPTRELFNKIQMSLQGIIFLGLIDEISVSSAPLDVNRISRDLFPHNQESNNLTDMEDSAHAACLVAFTGGRFLLATQDETTASKTRLENVKRDFLKKLGTIYSSTTARSIQQEAGNWSLVFPPTKDTFPATLNSALSGDRESSIRELADLQKPNSEKHNFTYAMHSISRRKGGEAKLNVADVCRDLMPVPVDDAASMLNAKIRVGPLTVKAGVAAEGIFRHELAHKVFINLQKNKMMSAHSQMIHSDFKTCLQTLHFPIPHNYLSEDYADFMSALTGDTNSANFTCLLVRENAPNYSLYREDGDDHSSLFFRLLHTEVAMGKQLPESCKQAAKLDSLHATIKSCK